MPTPSKPHHPSELLMPAGSLSRLKTALLYGADAVYAGTPDLSLRTQSEFSLDELAEGVALTHAQGKRIYLTLNLFTHNRDIETLSKFKQVLSDLRPDGVIVADPGVFQYIKDELPWLERHISTQANVASFLTVDYWQKQGAALCVLSREVSFEEITEIRERCPNIRLETFVHGALCMTYSGRCLLSNYMAERGSNQGNCAHSCRWKYNLKVARADGTTELLEITDTNMDEFRFFLEEEFRPGQLFPIEEDERGSYILNSRDLCLMPKLSEYLKLGIDSLKVEGRNKNEYYVGSVTRAYRQAIDAYYANPEAWDYRAYMNELETTKSRGYTLGFHDGRLTNLAHDYENGQSLSAFEFGGFIREWAEDALVLELRNRLIGGDILEFLVPGSLECVRLRLYELLDAETLEKKQKLSAGDRRALRVPLSLFHAEDASRLKAKLPVGTLVRKRAVLNADQVAFLEANQHAQKAELGLISASSLVARARSREVRPPPRLGLDGCCGLGCNGCLMFWNEPKFEGARAKLKARGIGALLPADLG